MRFGVQHAVGDPHWVPAILEPAAVRGFVRAAEASGFDAIGFTDHPSPSANWIERDGEGVADPISALGFCAGITDRIRLLTWLLIPAYHNPFHAAYQIATLDALSAGRVTLGLGTGYLRSELYAAGADPSTRLAEFDARLALMREAWTGATLSATGNGYSARGVKVLPPIVQQPHPPIWIHGNSPWGTRAARDANGWIAMLGSGPLFDTIRTVPIPDIEALKGPHRRPPRRDRTRVAPPPTWRSSSPAIGRTSTCARAGTPTPTLPRSPSSKVSAPTGSS